MSITALVFACATSLTTADRGCEVIVYRNVPKDAINCEIEASQTSIKGGRDMIGNGDLIEVTRYSECISGSDTELMVGNMDEFVVSHFGANKIRLTQFTWNGKTRKYARYVPGVRM